MVPRKRFFVIGRLRKDFVIMIRQNRTDESDLLVMRHSTYRWHDFVFRLIYGTEPVSLFGASSNKDIKRRIQVR